MKPPQTAPQGSLLLFLLLLFINLFKVNKKLQELINYITIITAVMAGNGTF